MPVELFYERLAADLGEWSRLLEPVRQRLAPEVTDLPGEPAHGNLRYTSAVLAVHRVFREQDVSPPGEYDLVGWLPATPRWIRGRAGNRRV